MAAERGLVVVIEDEPAIAELERLYLAQAGFGVHVAADGTSGLADVLRLAPVAVVVDVALPGLDGTELVRRLRAAENWVPVIVVTAQDGEVDRVLGIELGADDYLTKPFSPRELLARIRALLRRSSPESTDDPVEIGGLRLEPDTFRVSAKGVPVQLSPTEFKLLHYLMKHPDRVLSRAKLLDSVWGDHVFIEERTVDVHIRRLRLALQGTGHERLVDTVRGGGYRFLAA